MSTPAPRLVTIDDQITYIHGEATVLEVVESVQRETFNTATGRMFSHKDEGIAWARGWHFPHSETVQAMRASMAMAPTVPTRAAVPFPPEPAAIAGLGSQLVDTYMRIKRKP